MIDCDGKYVIRGCLRGADSFHDFEDRCVRRLDHQAEQALRKASEKVGNELAKEWNAKRIGAGQYLLVQNSDPTADGHQLWCCRTVDCTQYTPRSADMGMDHGGCVLHIAREKTKMPNSVGLAAGEHAITVQWCGGIRQPRTTGSSRSCMTPRLKSPSLTPARSASSLAGPTRPRCSPRLSV